MKKLVSLVSTALGCVFAVSALGCTDKSDFNAENFDSAKTPSQIYQALAYGIEQFFAYEGAITVEKRTETAYVQKEDEDAIIQNAKKTSIVCSINPQTNEFYVKEKAEEEKNGKTVSSERTRKIFKDGSEYFCYYAVDYNGYGDAYQPQQIYYKVENSYLGRELSDFISLAQEDFSFRADNFDDLKTAYQTVYTQQLSAEKWRYQDATATASVTANNTNGKLSVCVATEALTTEKLPEDENPEAEKPEEETPPRAIIKKQTESKRVAKEGKLASVQESYYLQATKQEENVEKSWVSEQKDELKVEYAFDTAGFKAIQTERPVNSILPTLSGNDNYAQREYSVDFCINGVWQTVCVKKEKNASANKIWTELVEKVGLQKTTEGYQLDGWYTDKNCEVALDEGALKKDAFNNMDVYATLRVNDGHAVIVSRMLNKDERSDGYKIVFGVSPKAVEETCGWDIAKIKESENQNAKTYYFPDGEVVLNGTKISHDEGRYGYYTIAYKDGDLVKVDLVNVIDESECSVFETDLSKIAT